MDGGDSKICPNCGQVRQNGICWRCRADDIRRSQGSQRWDPSGVRPERRINYEQSSPSTSPHAGKQELIKKPPTSENSLYLALDGKWYSEQKNIRININLIQRRWDFTLANGKSIIQYWDPEYKSETSLLLKWKGKELKARVGNEGTLILTGRGAPVHFINFKAEQKFRLCRKCLNKTGWRYENCHHCDWVFR